MFFIEETHSLRKSRLDLIDNDKDSSKPPMLQKYLASKIQKEDVSEPVVEPKERIKVSENPARSKRPDNKKDESKLKKRFK